MKVKLLNLFFTALFVGASVVVTSCGGDDDEPTPTPTPGPTPSNTLVVNGVGAATINLGGFANEVQYVEIKSTSNWTISNVPEWLRISSNNGAGNITLAITTTSENFSDEDRVANLTISGEGASASLQVTQVGTLPKNLRVEFSSMTIMSDGFAGNLNFPAAAKGYKEKIYTEAQLKSMTDRDIYNELMKATEYEGSLTETFSLKYNPETNLVYCVAAYGNENNADGSHKYGPMTIKRIKTKSKTLWADMYTTLTYTSSRWTINATRQGSYGQKCDEFYIYGASGSFAQELALYNTKFSDAFIAHMYIKPAIAEEYNNTYKNGPQTILYSRDNDILFFTSWGVDRDTKEFSAELSIPIYKNLTTANSNMKNISSEEVEKIRKSITHEKIEEIRKNSIIYKVD